MKSGLALLLLVVVAGIAECKPSGSLQQQVQARVAELRAKGKGKGGDGKDGPKDGKDGKGKDDKDDWPYGWIEFASLVGKCEAAMNWLEMFEMDAPEEGVLAEACPKAYEGCEHLLNATDDELAEATKFMNKIFPLLQCVNLQAEKEELTVALFLNGKNITEDVYLRETEELFNVCYQLFESVEAEIEEFDKDVDETDQKIEEQELETKRDAKIKALLRQLINTAAKKR